MRQRVEEHRHRLAASPTAVASDEEPADYIDAFLAEQQRRRQVGAADDEAEDFTGAPDAHSAITCTVLCQWKITVQYSTRNAK